MGVSARLCCVPCLVATVGVMSAQDATPDATLSPYFFVKSDHGSVDQLPLKSTSVKAQIAGVIAEVHVHQVYKNEGGRPLEAVYVFPGSTRAAVHAMTMHVGTRILKAQIQEKQQARQTYEAARQEGRTASLLEQHRPNVFQMNVANILPGDEIQVELVYTELLVPKDGTYSFVYPTVVGPRYTGVPGTASHTGEAWVANPHTPAGAAPLSTLDMEVRLDAGMPVARTSCDTHKTRLTYEGANRVVVGLDPAESHGGNRDFILKYQLAGAQVQSGLLLHRGKEENFFLLMAQPPARVTPMDMPPREFVFIMDVSGSQSGFPLEISKILMRDMLAGLRPQDRFNVMVFEGRAAFWKPGGSQEASPGNIREAMHFVDSQSGGGGTELGNALRQALSLPRTPGLSRTFVVSTDGYITADGQVFDLIRARLGEANLFAFGIGSSVNRHLIEGMAHAGQGEAFVVTRPERAPAEAARFRAYISSPVLTQVKLEAQGFEIYDVEPQQLPDVLAERPVICLGKWRGEPVGSVTVSGVGGRGPWQQGFDVAHVATDSDHGALRPLWARQRLQRLADYQRVGVHPDRVKEITSLGLTYDLLTDHTSFVAVDTEVRNPGAAPQTVVQPLPMPQGVSNAAIAGGSLHAQAYQSQKSAWSNAPGASATVEVVASSSAYDASCAAANTFSFVDGLPSLGAPAKTKPRVFRVGTLQADRELGDLTVFAQQLDQRLRELGASGVLKGLPRSLSLVLLVDEKGVITAATSGVLKSDQLRTLEALLVGFTLQGWKQPQRTYLRVPVKVLA